MEVLLNCSANYFLLRFTIYFQKFPNIQKNFKNCENLSTSSDFEIANILFSVLCIPLSNLLTHCPITLVCISCKHLHSPLRKEINIIVQCHSDHGNQVKDTSCQLYVFVWLCVRFTLPSPGNSLESSIVLSCRISSISFNLEQVLSLVFHCILSCKKYKGFLVYNDHHPGSI